METPILTQDNLIKALTYFSGQQQQQQQYNKNKDDPFIKIKEAEQALLHWEDMNPISYVVYLISIIQQSILSSSSVPSDYETNLALSAILSLKAAVKRHWKENLNRKTKRFIIDESTKEVVRNFAMEIIILSNTNNKIIQENVTSLLCVIVRIDVPLHSQTILPTLITQGLVGVQTSSPPSLRTRLNTAMAINTLLIELKSKRLPMDKKYIQTLTLTHVSQVSNCFQLCLAKCLQNNKNKETMGEEEQYLSIYIIKIINHCFTTSFPQLVSSSSFKTDVDSMLSLGLHILSQYRRSSISQQQQLENDNNTTIMVELEQLVVDVQYYHPLDFVEYLSSYLEYFLSTMIQYSSSSIASSLDNGDNNQKSFSLALDFLSHVIASCSKYNNNNHGNPNKEALYVSKVSTFLSSSDQVTKIMELVLKTMQITLDSLEEWKDDSESFYYEIYTNEDTISAKAQVLYLSMMENTSCSAMVLPYITSLLLDIDSQLSAFSLSSSSSSISNINYNPNMDIIMFCDALYIAVGISVNIIIRQFDFNSWFTSCIIPGFTRLTTTSTTTNNNPPVLKFRIVWLIGCFAHCFSYENYIRVLHILTCTLNVDNNIQDSMLQLGTIDSLYALFSESEYSYTTQYNILHPYYSKILHDLFQILVVDDHLLEYESKSKIKELIILLLKSKFASQFFLSLPNHDVVRKYIQSLSTIWQQEESKDNDHNNTSNSLLRKDVLIILAHIIANIKDDNTTSENDDNHNIMIELHSMIVPLIDNVLHKAEIGNSPSSLEDDAITLWLTLMRCSYNNSAHRTLPMLSPLYSRINHLIKIDEYTYLIPIMRITQGFIVLGNSSMEFLVSHSTTLCEIMKRCLGYVSIKGASYLHLVFEALMCNSQCSIENSCQCLLSSGLVSAMLYSCGMRYFMHKKCESDVVIVQYLTTLARILIVFPTAFDSLFPIIIGNDNNGSTSSDTTGRSSSFQQGEFLEMYYKMFSTLSHDESNDRNCSGSYGFLRRKLWMMLLISFLPTSTTISQQQQGSHNNIAAPTTHHSIYSPLIFKSVDQLLLLCVDIFTKDYNKQLIPFEISFDDESEEEYNIVIGEEEEMTCNNNCFNTTIRSELISNDMAYSTDLKVWLKMRLQDCAIFLGNENYNEMMSTVEPVTIQQLERILS